MTESTHHGEVTLEKTEAIRRAVEALGYDAPVPRILEYMRERFGIGAEGEAAVPAGEGEAPRPAKRGKNKPNE